MLPGSPLDICSHVLPDTKAEAMKKMVNMF